MLLGSGQVTTPPLVPMVQEAAGSCRCTTSTNCCKQQSASVEFQHVVFWLSILEKR